MRIGVMVPMSLSDGPGRMPSWEDIRAFAEHAEAVGLDSLWVCDHFLSGPEDGVVEGIHEAWTILSALAASTSRVELEDSPRRRVVPVDQLTQVGRVLGALALDGVVEASEGGVASHHLDVACPGGCALNVLPHVDTLLPSRRPCRGRTRPFGGSAMLRRQYSRRG
jgi:hypothetical protein